MSHTQSALQRTASTSLRIHPQRGWHSVAITIALLIGAWLRLFNLTKLGLEHDEVANWLIDRAIIDGKHAVYFQEAYGHEAGFHYVQTAFVLLLGDNALALRLPSALLGILSLAVSYALIRRVYSQKIATIALSLLAVAFFPAFYSRLALRAIMLPVFSGLSAYHFWRGWRAADRTILAIAGLMAGLSAYTYMASRTVPIFFALFMAYAFLIQRNRFFWQGWGAFWAVYAVVAAPLVVYLRRFPSAETRITEINLPLEALRNGDIGPVLTNARLIIGSFIATGDPLWRQNVAGTPIFTIMVALLFYAGVAILLWRRQPRDLFVLLWLATAVIPSLVTTDAPSTIRMINLLPLLTLPIAVTIVTLMHSLDRLSTNKPQLSTTFLQYSWIIPLTILGFMEFSRSIHYLGRIWPDNEEVQFVWQTAFTEAARWLDENDAITDAGVMGWTPDSMDAPTMQLAMRNDSVRLRHFGHELPFPMDTLVAPSGVGERVVIRPKTRPFHPALEQWLASHATITEHPHTVTYTLSTPQASVVSADPSNQTQLGNELTYLGFAGDCMNVCEITTFWRVDQPPTEPRHLFLHAVGQDGDLLAQNDGLAAPTQFWQTGDIIVKQHTIPAPAEPFELRLGVYHPQTFTRLTTPSGADFVPILLDP